MVTTDLRVGRRPAPGVVSPAWGPGHGPQPPFPLPLSQRLEHRGFLVREGTTADGHRRLVTLNNLETEAAGGRRPSVELGRPVRPEGARAGPWQTAWGQPHAP